MPIVWQEIEDRLYGHADESIRRFAAEHSDITCSFVAYDVDSPSFLLCFDTPSNALAVAQRTEQEAIARRDKMLSSPVAWRGAEDFSTNPPVLDYSYSPDLFTFFDFTSIDFDELEDVDVGDEQLFGKTPEDFLYGHLRIVLWRVFERLIAGDALRQVRVAPLCRLGYQLPGDNLTVLRILNWPTIS